MDIDAQENKTNNDLSESFLNDESSSIYIEFDDDSMSLQSEPELEGMTDEENFSQNSHMQIDSLSSSPTHSTIHSLSDSLSTEITYSSINELEGLMFLNDLTRIQDSFHQDKYFQELSKLDLKDVFDTFLTKNFFSDFNLINYFDFRCHKKFVKTLKISKNADLIFLNTYKKQIITIFDDLFSSLKLHLNEKEDEFWSTAVVIMDEAEKLGLHEIIFKHFEFQPTTSSNPTNIIEYTNIEEQIKIKIDIPNRIFIKYLPSIIKVLKNNPTKLTSVIDHHYVLLRIVENHIVKNKYFEWDDLDQTFFQVYTFVGIKRNLAHRLRDGNHDKSSKITYNLNRRFKAVNSFCLNFLKIIENTLAGSSFNFVLEFNSNLFKKRLSASPEPYQQKKMRYMAISPEVKTNFDNDLLKDNLILSDSNNSSNELQNVKKRRFNNEESEWSDYDLPSHMSFSSISNAIESANDSVTAHHESYKQVTPEKIIIKENLFDECLSSDIKNLSKKLPF